MNKAYNRINWQNEPSVATPLNETNLNKVDVALNEVDNRIITLDTTKADKSDVQSCLSNVTYNSSTGVFTFTFKNGQTYTADLNVEKIPVSFAMDSNGKITMTNADGTKYYAYLKQLLTEYSFNSSSEIGFEIDIENTVGVGIDESQVQPTRKSITASILDGSISASKLQANFLADCTSAKTQAESAASSSSAKALEAEGYAKGTQNGVAVTSGSPYYQKNAKYYAEHAAQTAFGQIQTSDVQLDFESIGQFQFLDSFLEDVDTRLDNALTTGNIADNLTTNNSGKVLSAKQGKVLNDKITALTTMKMAYFSIQPSEWETINSAGTTLYRCNKSIEGVTDYSCMFCELMIPSTNAELARDISDDWRDVISKECHDGGATFYSLAKPTHTLSLTAMFT